MKSFYSKYKNFLFKKTIQKSSLFLYKSRFFTISLNISQSIHFTDILIICKSLKLKYLIFLVTIFFSYVLINFSFLCHTDKLSLTLVSAKYTPKSSTIQFELYIYYTR